MKLPYTKEQINEAHLSAIRENYLPHAYLRPMAFYGSEGMGLRAHNLKVHVMVAAWEWPSYMSPEALELGIKVRTSSYTRPPREHHHVQGKSQRQLHELHVGAERSAIRWRR